MQQEDIQMDIIAEYYMGIRDYSHNEKYSGENSRVYTSPDSDAWLVLERKGKKTGAGDHYQLQYRRADATVYTRDKTVMRRLDALVIEYPDHYWLIGETDIDKTYEMPKSFVSYRKPRRLSEEQREAARSRARSLRDG